LLNNCCNCNENNNKTIYENLLNEKEELNKEIEELIEFLKNERLLINKLSKKLNL
jgi:translation initiation factor 2 beta subunit (eIF-2beta)/eIF-5